MTTFADVFATYDPRVWENIMAKACARDVEQVLAKAKLQLNDVAVLLSPAADPFLEQMAQKAHHLTVQRFGRVMQLYAPLYVSNECYNTCTYCSFTKDNLIPRKTLSEKEFMAELECLLKRGFQNILLLSGEDQRHVPLEYFERALQLMAPHCSYKAIEIYPLDQAGYERMHVAGADGVVVYQETYDPAVYATLHLAGPKRLFGRRLEVPDAVGCAGMRHVGIGALLGLSDWRKDVLYVAAHAQYLIKKYWQMKVSLSVPRIHKGPEGFQHNVDVNDRQLVQIITALRLFLPDCGLVLSTREHAQLRDHLVPLGITQMSVGSSTNPGGYSTDKDSLKQFEISDERSVPVFVKRLKELGYEPVWKDWDRQLSA